MTLSSFIQLFLGAGSFAGIAALLTVLYSRKKISAEAQKTRTEASEIAQTTTDRIIANLERENKRLQEKADEYDEDMSRIIAQLRELRDRIAVYDAEISDLRVLAIGTINWARRASDDLNKADQALRSHGIELQLTNDTPPDPKKLLAKFQFIEDYIQGSKD